MIEASTPTPLATGIDLLEIARMQEALARHGERLLQRIFTPTEQVEAGKNAASLAARFAAKEAVAKALGTGIGPVSWQEIEIRRGPANRPELHLYGTAQQRANELGLTNWAISLSHTQAYALASVVACGK